VFCRLTEYLLVTSVELPEQQMPCLQRNCLHIFISTVFRIRGAKRSIVPQDGITVRLPSDKWLWQQHLVSKIDHATQPVTDEALYDSVKGAHMSWRQKLTESMADVLRFLVRGAIIIDAIAISVASVYVVVKLCWWTVQWLDKVLFSAPW
jgi:hypothetical protein